MLEEINQVSGTQTCGKVQKKVWQLLFQTLAFTVWAKPPCGYLPEKISSILEFNCSILAVYTDQDNFDLSI